MIDFYYSYYFMYFIVSIKFYKFKNFKLIDKRIKYSYVSDI